MTQIVFRKIARDCQATDNLRAASKPPIYDYRVMIDGEWRATWARVGTAAADRSMTACAAITKAEGRAS
jgi:hypothetical protein